ncbi:tripartite motif-containing protein 45 [Patella vulgata]|uniref:tripartite motif-containing protein 45 n=1 Tax=Patella vulgata TaxID=6465 RepID=UPI0024A90978|nr:tripartite motif-containing protein 45 [Patella vulgata]XP_050389429.2 tripartite motif-containing protein 45 [Patella vulgata]XP_050389430.2 tripartite motif-containing protein 45 [Patella vulgata]
MANNIRDKPLCSICLNDFQQPKIIDCQHSFCFTCLEDYTNKVSTNNQFPCPLCRNIVNIPAGGVMDFMSNVDVQQVLVIDKTEVPPCDVCKTGVNSQFRCEDCEQYMCSCCRKMHDALKVCRDHVVVYVNAPAGDNPMSKSEDVCPNHPEKDIRCYCKDCSLSVCTDCFVIGHNGHNFLDLQDDKIKVETREKLKQLKADLDARTEQFAKYSNSLKALVTDIDRSADESCAAVDKQVETICSEVKQLGDDVKIQIQKSRDAEIDKMTKPLKEMEILIEDLKASVKCTVNVIDEKSIVQVLNKIPQVEQEKEECRLRKLDIPDVKYTCFEESVIDKTLLVKQLGTLLYQEHEATFTSSFNLDEIVRQGKTGLVHGPDYYIQGLPWCITAEKLTRPKAKTVRTLAIYLGQSELKETANVKSSQAKCSLTLINIQDKQQSKNIEDIDTYIPGRCRGWPAFIDWNKFSDKQNGFIDDNNNFTIQATVKVIKIDRG